MQVHNLSDNVRYRTACQQDATGGRSGPRPHRAEGALVPLARRAGILRREMRRASRRQTSSN